MEQYGGTCTSTFRKTRACLTQTSCMNGGTLQHGTCSCKEGYSGHFCEVHVGNSIKEIALELLIGY